MPITSSAKKALRNAARKRIFNVRKQNAIGKSEKNFFQLIRDKKVAEAAEVFRTLQKLLDKAAKTGLIKKNTASRKKSRLLKTLRKIS